MNYQEIQKMFERYKAPFDFVEIEYGCNVLDTNGELVCESEPEVAELICFCLNFTANAFSVIREN